MTKSHRYLYLICYQREASKHPWESVSFVHRLVEAMDDDEAASEARQQLNDEGEMPDWNMFLNDLVVRVD